MKEFFAAHAVELGIIIATITAIGVFVGPWLASWWQRKKVEQNRKLRAHFEELKREAELVISSASNLAPMARDFSIVVAVGSQAVTTSNIEEAKLSASFEAHFPERAKGLGTLKQETGEHNTNCENFRQKIVTDFREKGIPVEKYSRKDFCCIYEDAFDALFNMWRELAQNKPRWPNFQQINSEQTDGGYFLRAQNWASALAFAKTEDDVRKYKLVLAEIADDIGNQSEAAKILDSVNKLVEKAREFANQFAAKLDEINKYWPGKKTNKFKRLKKTCQTCKEL
jgi:hypothetical protein